MIILLECILKDFITKQDRMEITNSDYLWHDQHSITIKKENEDVSSF
jgi:hypothetical protein